MGRFISDKEMAELEASEPKKKRFISDEDMLKLESKSETKVEQPKEPEDKFGRIRAGARGIAQGVAFDFADEIEAGVRSAFSDKEYDELLEEVREEYKKDVGDYPVESTVGELIGTFGTGAGLLKLGTKVAPKAAGKLRKLLEPKLKDMTGKQAAGLIGTSAALGATEGAVSGLGEAEDKNIKAAAEGAKTGALFGLVPVVGIAGSKIGKSIGKGMDKAELSALGVSKLIKPEEAEKVAKLARDNKILAFTVEKTEENAKNFRKNSLEDLKLVQDSLKKFDIPLFDKNRAMREMAELKKEFASTSFDEQKAAVNFVNQALKELDKVNPNDAKSLQKLYSDVGAHLRERIPNKERQATSAIYKLFSDNIDDSLEAAGKRADVPDNYKQVYRDVSTNYRLANKLATGAEDIARKKAGLPSFTAGDTLRAAIYGPVLAGKMLIGRSVLGAAPTATSKIRRVLSRPDNKKKETEKVLDLLRKQQ